MRLRTERIDGLPPLAWCACFARGAQEVLVRHGPRVETHARRFVEGAWNGPFEASEPDEATTFAGTAGRLLGDRMVLATSTCVHARLFVHQTRERLLVSNSLVFALVAAGDAPDPAFPYYGEELIDVRRSGRALRGATLPTRDGALRIYEASNLEVGPDLAVRRLDKPAPPAPGDFASYRAALEDAIGGVIRNAADPARRWRYTPLTTLSQGYDSPAVSAVASRVGCREAFSFLDERGGGPDDGRAIAQQLGLKAHAATPSAPEDRPCYEAEFAVCAPGSAVTFAGQESLLAGRLLLRGQFGEVLLVPDDQRPRHGPEGGAVGGWTTTEFRLRVGFLDFAPLFLARQHRDALRRITASEEMRAFSLGTRYERPIPRRLVEEAGIAREAFGRSKVAGGHRWLLRARALSPESRRDYRAFVETLGLSPRLRATLHLRHLLHGATRRARALGLPVPELGRRCKDPEETGYLFHWGFARTRDRYAAAREPLPEALATLLERERLELRRASEISPLSAPLRRSFRLELTDGRTLKGRILRDASVARRMQRWISELPAAHFPAVLASHENASLEAWLEGAPCVAPDAAQLAEAGRMLARIHGHLAVEPLGGEDPRLLRWLRNADGWVSELASAARLTPDEAAKARGLVEALRPARARFGLRHGDFCGENLLHTKRGLVCVDNTTLRPGVLERDLAQTLYRWPLDEAGEAAFLEGYGRDADPAPFLESRRFWMIVTTLRAAAFRLREAPQRIDVPLAVLRRHVA